MSDGKTLNLNLLDWELWRCLDEPSVYDTETGQSDLLLPEADWSSNLELIEMILTGGFKMDEQDFTVDIRAIQLRYKVSSIQQRFSFPSQLKRIFSWDSYPPLQLFMDY